MWVNSASQVFVLPECLHGWHLHDNARVYTPLHGWHLNDNARVYIPLHGWNLLHNARVCTPLHYWHLHDNARVCTPLHGWHLHDNARVYTSTWLASARQRTCVYTSTWLASARQFTCVYSSTWLYTILGKMLETRLEMTIEAPFPCTYFYLNLIQVYRTCCKWTGRVVLVNSVRFFGEWTAPSVYENAMHVPVLVSKVIHFIAYVI